MRALLPLVLLGSSVSSASTPADSVDVGQLEGLGDVRYHLLETKGPERTYHIFVSLPDGYAESGDPSYPTIYLLDGGITFPLLSAYYNYLALGDEVPEAIVVGISYGTHDEREGNRRSTDFTAPSAEREHWGGAPVFQRFLSERLFPLVEKHYRSRADRRILFGQSLGGQFVLYTALTQPNLFWGHIASNPALHRNLPFFLSWQGGGAIPESGGRVFVSSGSLDEPQFRDPALEWIRHWSNAGVSKPWELRTITLDGHTHFSAVPEAFLAGVRWLLDDDEAHAP
ncbi:MAG TPA: alpha/beta hydrolase-fold protein [Vicinamibacteria bacterium]|nr:alpha/beta hydrolase-fold protein [Vicinamibacteria bacterium]